MTTLDTMTVKDLRQALENYPDDLPIVMAADAHDHCSQVLANRIGSTHNLELKQAAYSEYFGQFILPEEEYSDDYEDFTEVLALGV